MKTYQGLAVATLALGLSNCGGGTSGTPGDSKNIITSTHQLKGLTSTQLEGLDGTYESECTEVVSGGGHSYLKLSIRFLNPMKRSMNRYVRPGEDGRIVDTAPYGIYTRVYSFNDSECAPELVRGENKGEYEFSDQGKLLKIVSTEMSLSPMSASIAELFNRDRMCGKNNWSAGVEESIRDTDCDKNRTEDILYISRTDEGYALESFDAYLCDGNELGQDCSKIEMRKNH